MTQARHVRLRLARPVDAEFILALRLDETRNQYLSRVENDVNAQRAWLERYVEREAAQIEYYYMILDEDGSELGMVRLYDFRGDSFCWGSWVLKPGSPKYAALESALSVYETAFYQLGFQRSHFEVQKGNQKVIDFHLRFGAQRSGEDEVQEFFEISRTDYEATRERYAKFLA